MTFISVVFDYENTSYGKLAAVLEKSIKKNSPNSALKLLKIEAPEITEEERTNRFCFRENTEKLKVWVEQLEECEDKEIIFIDCDMMVLGDVSEVFKWDFDIAATKRTKDMRIKYNGGVIFVKSNERSRRFFKEFKRINDLMYSDPSFHAEWRVKYAGMNQAAFGWMVENYKESVKVVSVPCAEYNACSDDWNCYNKDTKIVHIKSGLRKIILENNGSGKYKILKGIWRDLENGK